MERKRIILLTPEENKYIQKAFGVSNVTVWHAVRYHRNNEIHRKIRKFAIERGNPQCVLAPEFDTWYLTNREDADGNMTQYMIQPFANGATIEGNRDNGLVTLRNKDGEVVQTYDNPRISEIKSIQELAASL